MDNLVEVFCDVDDFCIAFLPAWERTLLESGLKQRRRPGRMTTSEIMTVLIAFHRSNYRDFKNFYLGYVRRFWHEAFPGLLSYTRFLEVMASVLVPLCSYLEHRRGQPSGLAFIDSTTLVVCHNLRIPRHRVFAGLAQRGRNSMGWFYGFKLHLVVNHLGEILAAKLTPGNVDDRRPVPELVQALNGKLYGDKGYISQSLAEQLAQQGLELVTGVRKNMKAKAHSLWDKVMLSKRFIIETINDQLKNISQIEHSRHRSVHGFMLNLVCGLIAYCLKPEKPAIRLSACDIAGLQALSVTRA